VLVIPPGETYSPADVTKVDGYRRRFMAWFTWATDGRGTMDARLNGNGCLVNVVPDAGVVMVPPDDAGTMTPPELDAGNPFMEGPGDDAGMTVTPPPTDAGMNMPMPMTTVPPDDIAKLKPHCGCGSGLEGPVLLAALTLLHRRRRSQSR
jgi:hypothetical protein